MLAFTSIIILRLWHWFRNIKEHIMRVEMRQHTFPGIMKHGLSIVRNNFRRCWDYCSIYCIMVWPFSMSTAIHIHPWWSPNAKICCHIEALSAWFLLQGQQHYCILFFHANSIFRAPTFVQNSWAVLVKGRQKELLFFVGSSPKSVTLFPQWIKIWLDPEVQNQIQVQGIAHFELFIKSAK